MTHRRLAPMSALAIAAIALAGCSAAPAPTEAPDDGLLRVVAVTDVYGDIVQRVGGDRVEVQSIIAGTAQDPHSYEASSRDQLAVADADLIVVNGGGYDDFMDLLVDASGTHAPVVVAAEIAEHVDLDALAEEHEDEDAEEEAEHAEDEHEGHDHVEGFNEHVWYDLHGMEHVAEAIAEELAALDPDGAADYEANAAAFGESIDELLDRAAGIAAEADGAGVLITEPVPLYLLETAGFENLTPEAFSEAVEEGTDISPALLADVIDLVAGGDVALFAYNEQTAGPESEAVLEAAQTAGVPVVSFTETLPDGEDYLSWMSANLEAIATALA